MSEWTVWRRLAYTCGAPLIPGVLLARALRAARAVRRAEKLPAWTIPIMVAGAVISAIGEMLGYAGASSAATEQAMTELELQKPSLVSSTAP